MQSLRKILFLFSVFLALGGTGFWLFKGAHGGWTQTSIKVEKLDEITGLTYPTYEDQFLPGIDFLAGCLGVAVLIFLITFLFVKPAKSQR